MKNFLPITSIILLSLLILTQFAYPGNIPETENELSSDYPTEELKSHIG